MFREKEFLFFFILDFLAQDSLSKEKEKTKKKTFVEEIDFGGGGGCVDVFGQDSSGHYELRTSNVYCTFISRVPIPIPVAHLHMYLYLWDVGWFQFLSRF